MIEMFVVSKNKKEYHYSGYKHIAFVMGAEITKTNWARWKSNIVSSVKFYGEKKSFLHALNRGPAKMLPAHIYWWDA